MFARDFAIQRHDAAGCTYGALPYVYHLDQVVEVLKEFGITDEVSLSIGYLHDVIEDTPCTLDDLVVAGFSHEVVCGVWALTDVTTGKNRAERKRASYTRLLSQLMHAPSALTVKLADKIANARASASGRRPDLLDMYRKEYPEFCRRMGEAAPAYTAPAEMWDALDRVLMKDHFRGPAKRLKLAVDATTGALDDPSVVRAIKDICRLV